MDFRLLAKLVTFDDL